MEVAPDVSGRLWEHLDQVGGGRCRALVTQLAQHRHLHLRRHRRREPRQRRLHRRRLEAHGAEAHARQQLARQLLPGPFPAAAAGIHLWQPLPDCWTAADLERVARDEGLSVTSSEVFHLGPGTPNAIRISLGSIPERRALAQALERLAGLLRRRPRGLRDVIV